MRKIPVFFLLFLWLCLPASAASASLSGASAVRAGDTVTLTYSVSGNNLSGVSGELRYDASQLTLTGTKNLIGSTWKVEFSGNTFAVYDEALEHPINGSKALFSVTFRVKNVAAGSKVTAEVRDTVLSDGATDSRVGTVGWSATVKPPLSGDNRLASLAAANATISPAFSADVTSYTAAVPFEVSKLTITAKAADGNARVSVNSPVLKAGGTTNVTVTVTAENGAKKTYTIRVTRAQDPHYVPSANNALASIQVDGYVLSPPFSAEVGRYVVWLPYETERIAVSATPADGKASVTVQGGETLEAGRDNTVSIICTAENGDARTYIVVAKRASRDGGAAGEETAPSTAGTTTAVTLPIDSPSREPDDGGVPPWLTVLIGILCAAAGAAGTALLFRLRARGQAH